MIEENRKSLKSFDELECWKACTEARRFITELVKKYPKEERFSLVDDMKRAARPTTLPRGMGAFITRRTYSSVGLAVVHYMSLLIN